MPTAEDILKHGDICPRCKAKQSCAVADGLLNDHLKEVDEGIKKLALTPMTNEEWREFCSMTLHGPPPWQTLRRIYATVDHLMIERDKWKAKAKA